MTQYTHTITKEEISLLEIEEFLGRIIVIDTEKDSDKAVSYLSGFEAVGFDTETRPSFKKGTRYKISLMQISTDEACFLFRLNRIGIPPVLFRHCTAVCSAYSDLPLPLPPVTIYNIVHLSSFSPNCSSFHALKTYAKNVLIRISHHTSGLYSSISISANVSISR